MLHQRFLTRQNTFLPWFKLTAQFSRPQIQRGSGMALLPFSVMLSVHLVQLIRIQGELGM